MKSQSLTNQIQMPLVIGASELSSHPKDITSLNPLSYSLFINLTNNKTLQKFIFNLNHAQAFICNYKLNSQNQLEISNDQNQDLLQLSPNQNNTFRIFKEHPQHQSTDSQYQFSFQLVLSSSLNDNQLYFKISQENITFQLTKINSNIKFAKNDILNQLINPSNQLINSSPKTKGLLTMDQSSRFLLQSLTMPFPVIGFWIKTQQNLQNIQLYDHFSQFIKAKYQKKCTFTRAQNESKHFYFVRVSEEKRMETFIVSWKINQPITKEYRIKSSAKTIKLSSTILPLKEHQFLPNQKGSYQFPKKLASIQSQYESSQNSSNNEHFITSSQNSSSSNSSMKSQQNGMNFTLRKYNHKNQPSTLESLINYSYLSPIKQLQSTEKQDNLFSQNYQNSPQFSTLMKQQTENNQNAQLKAKIQSQEIQITKLKEIIAQMQSQLKLYKNSRMSTHYESNRKKPHFTGGISSPESNLFSVGSNPTSKDSSPRVVGRLRESDLRSNSASASWSGDWLKNSSNKKGLGLRIEIESGSKDEDSSIKREIPDLFGKQIKQQKFEQRLPEIKQENGMEEGKDPWEYMELVED